METMQEQKQTLLHSFNNLCDLGCVNVGVSVVECD